ncbi:MAG: GNAT family N-acetyltransferase [Rhodospirillales bacterium]
MTDIRIRPFTETDLDATARVFFDAVRHDTKDHYTGEQRRAWAPDVPATPSWRARLEGQTVFVAERNGEIVGFMGLTAEGRIDLAFVAPEMIGRGIGKKLYGEIDAHARAAGLRTLTVHASRQARGFFERRGWRTLRERTVTRGGVDLTNYLMEIELA